MKNPLSYFCLLAMLMAGTLSAQSPLHCGTDALLEEQIASQPDLLRQIDAQEVAYRRWLQESPTNGSRMTMTIPVVIHLIQYSCISEISDARVQSQIDVLNEDFRLLNPDTASIPAEFRPLAADTEIEFCLARIDPNGCPTDGIVRVVAPELADHDIGQSGQMKAVSQWDPQRYLNIWVPVTISGGILGYATFPFTLQSNPAQDGVVINGRFFGRANGIAPSGYALGRTGTHEVGHWLGLFHTFQGGCSGMTAADCDTDGDRVCDTPPTSGPNYGCPSTQNTCNEMPNDLNDLTVNYMDYGDDVCLLMFSNGQSDRMGFFLNGIRDTIWSATNLTATGCDGTQSPGCLPVVDIGVDRRVICAGDSVTFTDLSSGPPDMISWSFPGASPVSSSQSVETVTYAQPGTYLAYLTATNGVGFDVNSVEIQVVSPQSGPWTEGFEGAGLPNGWDVMDEDKAGSWELTGAAYAGQQAMVVRNYFLPQKGSQDNLISRPFDLSFASYANLTFEYAYKRRTAFATDTLKIWISQDCGSTWDLVWNKGGIDLSTTPGLAIPAEFVPVSSQYRRDTVDLLDYLGQPSCQVMFQCIGGFGQSLYLDQIGLGGLFVGREDEIGENATLEIIPNPSVEAPELQVELRNADHLRISLQDLSGRVLWESSGQNRAQGRHLFQLNEANWGNLGRGMYIITVKGNKGLVSKKVIKM